MVHEIHIVGARQHNLRNINVTIPRDALVVITGPSGSGKSSLAFDTLYAEGQRRYVESLSTYARQFLDQLQKPLVDHIDGLSPAIAIEQRSAGSSPRSIVATSTEIYDYLRLLFAHIGHPHCPKCGLPVTGQSPQKICDRLQAFGPGRKIMLLAPRVQGRKGEHKDVLAQIQKEGLVRLRVDGDIVRLEDMPVLKKNVTHDIEAVIDRIVTGSLDSGRLNDSVERCLRLGEGYIKLLIEDESTAGGWREELISEHLSCADCGISIGELLPRNFSFNSPYGACPDCHGLGIQNIVDEASIIDTEQSLAQGAVTLWQAGPRRLVTYYRHVCKSLAAHYDFSLDTPFKKLPKKIREIMIHGSGNEDIEFSVRVAGRQRRVIRPFEGVVTNLNRRFLESDSSTMKERLRKIMVSRQCPSCSGYRLRAASLAVTVADRNISTVVGLSIDAAGAFFDELDLQGEEAVIAAEIIREIRSRLGFLHAVGLGYITLDRVSNTLSGGEAQRIRLATQVGSGLVGVLYVLDEPSIGLHQRDNQRLLDTLGRLRDLGNTVIVVEHDLETVRAADHVIDLGPRAGIHGGEVICYGTPATIAKCSASLTGQYLSGATAIDVPQQRNTGNGRKLRLIGAGQNNLKDVDVSIGLGQFCCISGVSGSGKSTLINDILVKAVSRHFKIGRETPGVHKEVQGLEYIDKMIVVNQSPIGRTPRSNPVTYTGAFDQIRTLFAQVPDSRVRGYKPGRFSFNVKGGRCEECHGDGIRKIEMQFLPDVFVQCEACKGKRYNRETLTILYKGRNIAEVLDMTVEEAAHFFRAIPRVHRILQTLFDVGLGYIHLGQPATTLSGGEAQRVKLSTELARSQKGHTLYILDEPTTGLHVDDIRTLLDVLRRLRDHGNTVLVIEHNLDVLKVADHIIDLGPEGGDDGGTVIVAGTPEDVARCKKSYTGQYLAKVL